MARPGLRTLPRPAVTQDQVVALRSQLFGEEFSITTKGMLKEFQKTHGGYFVYFVGSDEVQKMKIGIAKDVVRRVAELRCGSPCQLYVLAFMKVFGHREARRVEKQLHECFKNFHSHGEWFHMNESSCKAVEEIVFDVSPQPIIASGEQLLRSIFQSSSVPALAY